MKWGSNESTKNFSVNLCDFSDSMFHVIDLKVALVGSSEESEDSAAVKASAGVADLSGHWSLKEYCLEEDLVRTHHRMLLTPQSL